MKTNHLGYDCFLFAALAEAAPDRQHLGVCEVLDHSRGLAVRPSRLEVYLNGSSDHGYSLFEFPDASSRPCPGWRERYFTAPSVLTAACF